MRAAPRAASAWQSEPSGCAGRADGAALAGVPTLRAGSRRDLPKLRGQSDVVIGCIVRSSDFERVLRVRSRVCSAHFALHYLPATPALGKRAQPQVVAEQLSTGAPNLVITPVDDRPSTGLWLGSVVPKRHARRAVTRNLIKRQIRAAVARHVGRLEAGLWVVRLRGPFDRARFTSAASGALKHAARAELEQVLTAAGLRMSPA